MGSEPTTSPSWRINMARYRCDLKKGVGYYSFDSLTSFSSRSTNSDSSSIVRSAFSTAATFTPRDRRRSKRSLLRLESMDDDIMRNFCIYEINDSSCIRHILRRLSDLFLADGYCFCQPALSGLDLVELGP